MRALVIDNAIRAAAKQLMAHARRNIYRPGGGGPPPGDDPNFVMGIPNGYKVVFTYTADHGGALFRHMSVSVPAGKYPSPEAVAAIAELFEYTGTENGFEALLRAGQFPSSWIMAPNEADHCIVLVEPLQ